MVNNARHVAQHAVNDLNGLLVEGLLGIAVTAVVAYLTLQVDAKKAKKLGLVDEVVQAIGPGIAPAGDNTRRVLEEAAITAARRLADGASPQAFGRVGRAEWQVARL